MAMSMKLGDYQSEIAASPGHGKALRQVFDQFASSLFVPRMTRKFVFVSCRFTEIVYESRKAYLQFATELFGLIDNHHRVQPGIDFRMPFRRLRNAEQCVNLREDDA